MKESSEKGSDVARLKNIKLKSCHSQSYLEFEVNSLNANLTIVQIQFVNTRTYLTVRRRIEQQEVNGILKIENLNTSELLNQLKAIRKC